MTGHNRDRVMSNKTNAKTDVGEPAVYQIRLRGHLGGQWTDWFEGLTITLDLSPAPPESPHHQRVQIAALNPSSRQVSTTAQEFRATPQSTAQAHSLRSLGEKPLAVVSAGTQSSGWLKLQDDLATLSPNSKHRVVEGATHTSVVYGRSDAQATSAAIVEVVGAVRNDRPLAR